MKICNLFAVLVVLILVIIFSMTYLFGVKETKYAILDKLNSDEEEEVEESESDEEEVEEADSEGEGMLASVVGESFASVTDGSGLAEPFNNDLYNPDVDIDSNNYESALKNMVLEPEVFTQHQKFNQELMHRVGGTSSRSPVRDDNMDVVPWVGLKRPAYQKINPNDGTARTVPSVRNADDLADYQQIMWKSASKM